MLEEHLSVGVVGAQVGHVLERTWTRCEDNKTGENQNIFLSILIVAVFSGFSGFLPSFIG